MPTPEVLRALARHSVATLCSTDPRVRAMAATLTPLFPGARIAGPAKTARITPGQNAAIHQAVHSARPGDVVVVSAGGDAAFGPFGDILATCCRNQGVQGIVIDGTIRDVAAVRAMRFPVFCLGANPTPTAKSDPGAIDLAITCGGVSVRPGDLVIGDDDGVVVVPADVAEGAAAVGARERHIFDRLANGETTCDIFEIHDQSAGREPVLAPPTEGGGEPPPGFYDMDDPAHGIPRRLAPGVRARIFGGDRAMLSLVALDPHAEGPVHSHPEEQWGVLLEGSGDRMQDGHRVAVEPGSFWRTPGGVPHGFIAGPRGARILDIFSPPRPAYLSGQAETRTP